MPRSQIWKSKLFLIDLHGYLKISNHGNTDIHVGIWWHNKRQLIGFAQPVISTQKSGGLIDSDLTHAEVWDSARREFSDLEETEYFSIPRGRILWDTVRGSGILYHGNATSPGVLRKLAKLFGHPKWEARLDGHYLTGEALEAYYSLE